MAWSRSENRSCLSQDRRNHQPVYEVDYYFSPLFHDFLWLTGSSKTHLFPLRSRISQANTAMLLFSQQLCCAGNEGSTLDEPRDSSAEPLIYSTGTAGHLSCNKNKMSLWPRAPNLLLNPHFKESYYTGVRLNQTKLQCLRSVAHFQISAHLPTSPSETQSGTKQSDPNDNLVVSL